MSHQKILILDFGSQVTQLIARRVREASYSAPGSAAGDGSAPGVIQKRWVASTR